MRSLFHRTRIGILAFLLGFALSAAPVGAYCNSDPCQSTTRTVCSICSYFVTTWDGSICRITVFYCVDCSTGEWLQWDETVDYCIYGSV